MFIYFPPYSGLMDAMIILYRTKDIEPKFMTKIIEKLFGKVQKSNYGKYEYEVTGVIPKGAYIRPIRAVVIVKKEYHQKITELFDVYSVQYRVFGIKVDSDVFKNKDFF